ncbi:MAG: hypothetical protein H7235_06090 [Bdellovibrionaceae bacterium]|nr:hypothetical protein [Pseudobdellovibrionaceae bacterium]
MLLFNLLLSICFAGTPRIESKYVSAGESSKIYLKPGLVSVLEFPYPILEVRIGNPAELKGAISQVSPKEITLYLKSSHSRITNLIVRSDKKLFIFDVIPSESQHQDYVRISGSLGSITVSAQLLKTESVSIAPGIRKLPDIRKPHVKERISL